MYLCTNVVYTSTYICARKANQANIKRLLPSAEHVRDACNVVREGARAGVWKLRGPPFHKSALNAFQPLLVRKLVRLALGRTSQVVGPVDMPGMAAKGEAGHVDLQEPEASSCCS